MQNIFVEIDRKIHNIYIAHYERRKQYYEKFVITQNNAQIIKYVAMIFE